MRGLPELTTTNSPRGDQARKYLPAIAGFCIPFVLIVYLAMEAGGYDIVVRSQVGIIVWWAVLLGGVAGLLPVARITRIGWIGLAVLAAIAVWTGIAALTWTQSTERSMIELSRVAMLLGVFVLLLMTQGKDGLRRSLSAVAAATVVIAVVALASRFHPDWFTPSVFPENYPKARLNYPLGYWNGLATLMAMGTASLVWAAVSAQTMYWRILAAGALPVLVLTCFLTASRGGAIEVAVALLVLLALFPRRLLLMLYLVIPAAGSAILLWLITQRPELRDNAGGAAVSQGAEMIWLTIGVVLLTCLIQAGLAIALRNRGSFPVVSRKTAQGFGILVASLAVVVVIAGLASGFVGDRWNEFKQPVEASKTVDRLSSVSSGERYEQWASAIDASSTERLTGIGPGAYEFWWARTGDGVGFVRDAHSFYLEGLAELGILGFLLTLAFVLIPLGYAVSRSIRPGPGDQSGAGEPTEPENRKAQFAATAAGMAAFAVGAGVDWAWEMTVLPVVFLVLAAAALGPDANGGDDLPDAARTGFSFSVFQRIGVALLACVALLAIGLPLAGTQLTRQSQSLFREGDLSASLDKAEQAVEVQPYSSSARIQLAQLQAYIGEGTTAMATARRATKDDPYNWRTWLVLSQIAGQEDEAAIEDRASSKASLLSKAR